MPRLLIRSIAVVAITLAIFAGSVVASGGTSAADLAPLQGELASAQAAYDAALTTQRELSARAQ